MNYNNLNDDLIALSNTDLILLGKTLQMRSERLNRGELKISIFAVIVPLLAIVVILSIAVFSFSLAVTIAVYGFIPIVFVEIVTIGLYIYIARYSDSVVSQLFYINIIMTNRRLPPISLQLNSTKSIN